MSRTKTAVKTETKIMRAFLTTAELEQYKMPGETGLSYRTILRTLKPLESQGFIKLVRVEPSEKGGKEKKIYALTLKGVFTFLNSIVPTSSDFLSANGKYNYTIDLSNQVIVSKIKPCNLKDLAKFLKVCGVTLDFAVFKEIDWFEQHYGSDIYRAIVNAAAEAIAKDKLPNVDYVKKIMIDQQGMSAKDAELDIKEFLNMELITLREIFIEAFAFQVSFLHGNGNLHNENLYQIFSRVTTEIEQKNQSTLAPLKRLVERLK